MLSGREGEDEAVEDDEASGEWSAVDEDDVAEICSD
jgi:hypothetical protein